MPSHLALGFLDSHMIPPHLFNTINENEFSFTLPHSKNNITFKLLTHKDEQDITRELEGLKKIKKQGHVTLIR